MLKRILFLIFVGILFTSGMVFASGPTFSSYNLSDIYNKISSPSFSPSDHVFYPATTPSNTLNTLTDIWNNIPSFKTLAEGDLISGIFPAGMYASSTDLTLIEPQLLAENIATGKTLFGVSGTCQGIPTNSLVAYWPFNGNANDVIGGNNGTVVGATLTTGVKGVADTAYSFTPITSVNVAPVTPFLKDYADQFSVAAWINVNGFASTDWRGIAGPAGAGCGIDTDKFIYHLGVYPNSTIHWLIGKQCRNWGIDLSSAVIATGEWHQAVGVYSGNGTASLYVDGVFVTSVSNVETNVGSGLLTTATHLGIGGTASGFDGSIDNVRFYNRVLTTDEIELIYNIEKP